MKKIILIIALITFIGCYEEAPTEPKIDLKKEYTLEELENDPDWVEITDIDTLELPCIWLDLFELGKIYKSEAEYELLYNESKDLMDHSEMHYCKDDTNYIDVDFESRSLILFEVRSNGGGPFFKRKIFKNSKFKQYRYLIDITITDVTKENSGFTEAISIPNVSTDMEIIFDTLRYYEWN